MRTVPESPEAYLAALEEPRRQEVTALHDLIRTTLPGWTAHVRSGMLGYGSYHYEYDSGRSGDAAIVSLASRKGGITLYVDSVVDGQYLPERRAAELRPATVGRSCVRIRRLAEVDLEALRALLEEAGRVGPPGRPASPPSVPLKAGVAERRAGRGRAG